MAEQSTLYPLEFYIAETPRSLQASSRSKERWKATVREAAQQRATQTDEVGLLDVRPLAVTIYYFPDAPMQGDVDNIIKPILDAIEGVAYLKDKNIERVIAQKFEPQHRWEFVSPTTQLATTLDVLLPVLYVRVDDDLSWRKVE
jgi:crossover junction endodeoxyribonuclease RusA